MESGLDTCQTITGCVQKSTLAWCKERDYTVYIVFVAFKEVFFFNFARYVIILINKSGHAHVDEN